MTQGEIYKKSRCGQRDFIYVPKYAVNEEKKRGKRSEVTMTLKTKVRRCDKTGEADTCSKKTKTHSRGGEAPVQR